jgi:hypothetical protein
MTEIPGASGLGSIDSVLRIMAVAIPVAVLVTLLLVLMTKRRARRRTEVASRGREIKNEAEGTTQGVMPVTVMSEHQSGPLAALLAETPVEDMKARLSHSITYAPKAAQAPIYLQLARLLSAQGDEAACLVALRSAAGLAVQHGPRSVHAEARLELAEAAYKAGDLTGACEQWQMARTALLDDGQKEAHARVDKRMRDNGCPTDWVLTDF